MGKHDFEFTLFKVEYWRLKGSYPGGNYKHHLRFTLFNHESHFFWGPEVPERMA